MGDHCHEAEHEQRQRGDDPSRLGDALEPEIRDVGRHHRRHACLFDGGIEAELVEARDVDADGRRVETGRRRGVEHRLGDRCSYGHVSIGQRTDVGVDDLAMCSHQRRTDHCGHLRVGARRRRELRRNLGTGDRCDRPLDGLVDHVGGEPRGGDLVGGALRAR